MLWNVNPLAELLASPLPPASSHPFLTTGISHPPHFSPLCFQAVQGSLIVEKSSLDPRPLTPLLS